MQVSEQVAWVDAQGVRQDPDVVEADVPLPALDAAHVRPIQTCNLAKPFLRQAEQLAQLAHSLAEGTALDQTSAGLGHRTNVAERRR